MMPYDPSWYYGEEHVGIEFNRDSRSRKKPKKDPDPVVAQYAKTNLIERHDAILGDGCRTIVME